MTRKRASRVHQENPRGGTVRWPMCNSGKIDMHISQHSTKQGKSTSQQLRINQQPLCTRRWRYMLTKAISSSSLNNEAKDKHYCFKSYKSFRIKRTMWSNHRSKQRLGIQSSGYIKDGTLRRTYRQLGNGLDWSTLKLRGKNTHTCDAVTPTKCRKHERKTCPWVHRRNRIMDARGQCSGARIQKLLRRPQLSHRCR